MTWEGHPRTTTPRWRKTRRQALERDAHTCTVQGCNQPANEVDHIIPWFEGGTDDLDNAASLCPHHHATKTSAEGHRARWRHKATRTPEAHPGLT